MGQVSTPFQMLFAMRRWNWRTMAGHEMQTRASLDGEGAGGAGEVGRRAFGGGVGGQETFTRTLHNHCSHPCYLQIHSSPSSFSSFIKTKGDREDPREKKC